jgi:hypothetical protein
LFRFGYLKKTPVVCEVKIDVAVEIVTGGRRSPRKHW